MKTTLTILMACFFWLSSAAAYNVPKCLLFDQQVAQVLINLSKAQTGSGSCACPNDRDNSGTPCGHRSQWSQSGGQSPKCFISDISYTDIAKFRQTTCLQQDFCCQGHQGACGCIGSLKHSRVFCCDGTLSKYCTSCLNAKNYWD